MSDRWIVNAASVAAEDFDGETVVINFDSGQYFSFAGAASWIWRALARPVSVAAIADAAPEESRAEVAPFFASLSAAGLIVPADAVTEDAPPPPPAPWQTPRVEVFSDLAELIALDPVHEVDAMIGWPRRADRTD